MCVCVVRNASYSVITKGVFLLFQALQISKDLCSQSVSTHNNGKC